MDGLTTLYVSLFLIACLTITMLAIIQATLKIRKVKELMHEIELDHVQLKQAESHAHKLQAEISTLADKAKSNEEDSITHLMGWRLFVDSFHKQIKEAQRYRLTLALLLINIKDLSMINDALSHEVGDALLKEIAERISINVRDVDSVARFNENTFAVLLSQIAKPETAVLVVQRIIQALKEAFDIVEHELFVTTSIGISTYPADGKDVESLLQTATLALGEAIESGVDNYQFYQQNMHLRSQRELALQTALARGLETEDFMIYYQPILDVQTNKINCMDIALHWQYAGVGELNPVELFNYAEKHHKLNIITEWLLENSCRDYLAWRGQAHNPKLIGLPLFINQLEHSHIVYRISQILQKYEFNPAWLMLEIKGSLQKISLDVLEKSFNMLNYLNINICITDFGHESLSLNFIKNIKIDYVKLDPSLIIDIVDNARTAALIESIVLLMQKLAIRLIATGVTNESQFKILKQLGVSDVEGPFVAPAIASHEMRKKIMEYSV